MNAAEQAGIEGTEEFISEYANNISDQLIMGSNSQLNQLIEQYMSQGMSREDAGRKAFNQLYIVGPLVSGLSGALSGGAFGGGASVYGNVKNALKSNMLNATQPISSVNDFKQIIPQDTRQDSSTSVDTDPDIHTPVEQKIIDDYQSSVDENLVQFINYSLENKGSNSGKYVLNAFSLRRAA